MDILQLFPKLKEKSVTLSSLEISHRVFLNWKEKGLIAYTPEYTEKDIENEVSRKRIELNFFDALWLLIVKELRMFHIDLSTIRKIGEFLYQPIDTSFISKLNPESIEETTKKLLPNKISDMVQEVLNKELLFKGLESIPNDYKIYHSNIGSLINTVLLFNNSPSLMIYKKPLDENIEVYIYEPNSEEFFFSKKGKDFRNETIEKLLTFSIVNIPIRPLIGNFFENEKLFKHSFSFDLLTPSELELLKILKTKDFQKIVIYNNNSVDFTIEKTSVVDLKGEQAKKLRRTLGLKQYEKAEVFYRNDKHLVVKNIIKQQL